MPKFTKPRPNIVEAEMDITPMIDCTFLLLIFFLVSSRIDATAVLQLPQAKRASAVVVQQSVVLTVKKGSGERPLVYRGDGESAETLITGATPADVEAAVTEYVDELTSRNSQVKYVLIKAEAGVKHRDVSSVAKAASAVEAVQELYVGVLESKQ